MTEQKKKTVLTAGVVLAFLVATIVLDAIFPT